MGDSRGHHTRFVHSGTRVRNRETIARCRMPSARATLPTGAADGVRRNARRGRSALFLTVCCLRNSVLPPDWMPGKPLASGMGIAEPPGGSGSGRSGCAKWARTGREVCDQIPVPPCSDGFWSRKPARLSLGGVPSLKVNAAGIGLRLCVAGLRRSGERPMKHDQSGIVRRGDAGAARRTAGNCCRHRQRHGRPALL